MTTAVKIIESALNTIGVHTHVMKADPSLISDGFLYLVSFLEELKSREIILAEENSDGEIVTIESPTSLASELNEPRASTIHIINYLAVTIAGLARVPLLPDGIMIGQQTNALHKLSQMFRQHTFVNIKPDSLLPKGQGNKTSRSLDRRFFDGEQQLGERKK